mgnify:CR=1 FL=1
MKRVLSEVLTDPERRRKMAQAGDERLSLFSWEKTAARYTALLDRIALS